MKLNKVVSTLEMPHDEWLRYRKKGIGGSDAGAICGVNKYRSAVSERKASVVPMPELSVE